MELLSLQPPDLSRLAAQLSRILEAGLSQQETINQLLQLTIALVNGAGAIFYREQDRILYPVGQLLSRQVESMSADISTEFEERAQMAIREGKASVLPLPRMPSAFILSCPIAGVETLSDSCLSVLVVLGDTPKEPFLIILQLMAAILSRTVRINSSPHPSGNSSQELLTYLAGLGEIPDLRTFNNILRQWLGCEVLAVGFGAKQGGKLHLKSVTDVVKVDSRTSQSRKFLKVMQECLQQMETIAWPSIHAESTFNESLLLKELVQANGMRQGVAVALPGASGKSAVLVFLWSEEESRAEQIGKFLEAVPLLGLMMQTLGATSSVHSPANQGAKLLLKRNILLSVLVLLFVGVIFYPAKFSLHPNCQVVPVQVHYVVTRFDGLLEKVFVEPGDNVEQKDKLAILDGRELELELRSIRADSAKELKLRDNHLATGNTAAAQIGYLEYQRLQERANLLLIRQKQLLLESPADGVVVSGDLKRAEGGPVSKGQVLFEIAPLKTVLIELAVADADISHVKEQAEATVRFDAFPGRSWLGKVDRITPKSVLFQGQNVFIVSFQIVNSDNLLQPGMQGRASVECGRKSLLWIYFHKPWYALIRLLRSIY